jgi:hypothetical protein
VSLYHDYLDAVRRADKASHQGEHAAARVAYAEAAESLRAWVDTLHEDQPKTRSVFTASTIFLLVKANDHDGARAMGAAALGQSWLLPESAAKIRNVLDTIATPPAPSGTLG